jgi:hypothetical protein
MVEEFLLIQCGKVGFFVTPAVYKLGGGTARVWDADGRVATIDLDLEGCHMRIGSVYVPPMGGSGDRISVLDCIEKVRDSTAADRSILFGGDWNSHIGREGVEGRQAMLQPTSAGGRQMLTYLATKLRDKFLIADQKLVLRKRGTWCNNSGIWYELDYFLVSKDHAGRCSKLQAVAMGESDHAAKIVNFRMANVKVDKTRWRDNGHKVSRGFDVAKLSDEKTEERFGERLDRVISEDLSWQETTKQIRDVAAEELGERPKAGPDPIPAAEAREMRKVKDLSRDLYARARECKDAEEARELLKQSRRKAKEYRTMTRRAENNQWQAVAKSLQEADAKKNWRAFWHYMRKLKLYGAPPGNPIRFSPEVLREHFNKFGLEPNKPTQFKLLLHHQRRDYGNTVRKHL